MAAEQATALVLRVVEWSESSAVVTLFTREFGKVRGVAKGARRPKGPFESALDLLSLCRIVFLRKSSEALDLLTEAKLERRFRPSSRDLASLYAGYYVAELLDAFTDDYDPHIDLFDAAVEVLVSLAAGNPVPPAVLRFELSALDYLGHLPSLANCAECGVPVETTGRVAFGQLSGGVLCKTCRPGKRNVMSVSGRVIATMASFADRGWHEWPTTQIDPSVAGELRGVMNHYLSHLLGRKPRMHEYLKILSH